MFDCNSFLRRMGWRQKDLSERLGIGTSTVGMWCTGKSSPSLEVAEKLVKLGMTVKELFGEEVDEIVRKAYMDEIRPEASGDKGAIDGVERAVVEMKARGIIKDEVAREIASMRSKGLI